MKINLLRAGYGRIARTPDGRSVEELAPFYPAVDVERPKTRGDCVDGPRPCPWVACRHHLYLDVGENGTSITFNFPDKDVDELDETCALDVADRGGVSQLDIAATYGVSPQSVDEIEQRGRRKLKGRERLREVAAQQGRFGNHYRLPLLTDDELEVEGQPDLEEAGDDA